MKGEALQAGTTFGVSIIFSSVLAVSRSVGNFVSFWQPGLKKGLKPFFVAVAFQAFGYICSALCFAELLSALPFTGGTYGIVRGILGPFMGLLIGFLELLTIIGHLGELLLSFGESLSLALGCHRAIEFLFWAAILIVSGRLLFLPSERRCQVHLASVVLACVFVVVYMLSSATQIEPKVYYYHEDRNSKYMDKAIAYMAMFPYPSVLYSGLQLVPMIAKGAEQLRAAIGYGIISMSVFTVLASFVIVILCSTQYPGPKILSMPHNHLPLSYGFSNAFGLSVEAASVFNLPLLTAGIFVTLQCLVTTVSSMIDSGLVPSNRFFAVHISRRINSWLAAFKKRRSRYLSTEEESERSPSGRSSRHRPVSPTHVTQLFTHLLVFGFTLTLQMLDRFSHATFQDLTVIYILCVLTTYSIILVTYLVFRFRFFYLSRNFRNPFGTLCAILGLAVYVSIIFATLFYSHGGYVAIAFALYFVIAAMVYKRYVKQHQKFNEEEEQVMFVIYVMRANQAKLRAKLQLQQQQLQPQESSGSRVTDLMRTLSLGPKVRSQQPSPRIARRKAPGKTHNLNTTMSAAESTVSTSLNENTNGVSNVDAPLALVDVDTARSEVSPAMHQQKLLSQSQLSLSVTVTESSGHSEHSVRGSGKGSVKGSVKGSAKGSVKGSPKGKSHSADSDDGRVVCSVVPLNVQTDGISSTTVDDDVSNRCLVLQHPGHGLYVATEEEEKEALAETAKEEEEGSTPIDDDHHDHDDEEVEHAVLRGEDEAVLRAAVDGEQDDFDIQRQSSAAAAAAAVAAAAVVGSAQSRSYMPPTRPQSAQPVGISSTTNSFYHFPHVLSHRTFSRIGMHHSSIINSNTGGSVVPTDAPDSMYYHHPDLDDAGLVMSTTVMPKRRRRSLMGSLRDSVVGTLNWVFAGSGSGSAALLAAGLGANSLLDLEAEEQLAKELLAQELRNPATRHVLQFDEHADIIIVPEADAVPEVELSTTFREGEPTTAATAATVPAPAAKHAAQQHHHQQSSSST